MLIVNIAPQPQPRGITDAQIDFGVDLLLTAAEVGSWQRVRL
jgi:hypothetical protein